MEKEIYTKLCVLYSNGKGFEWHLKVKKERSSLDSSLRMGSLPKLCLYKREEKKWLPTYNGMNIPMREGFP